MTCSYSGDPSTSDLDAVRFLIRDTDCTKNIFENEEITFTLGEEANIYTAAACLLEAAINKSTGTLSSKKVGDLALSFSVAETRKRIETLKAKGRVKYEIPLVPAQDRDSKREHREDVENVPPFFTREIHDIDRLRDTREDFEEAK